MYALDIDILCVVFMYMYCIPENTVYNVFAQFKLFIIITFRHAGHHTWFRHHHGTNTVLSSQILIPLIFE